MKTSTKLNDPRSRSSLAWVYARRKDYARALQKIAEGLALDRIGQYRERLLLKQREILDLLAQRNQQEQLRMANRISSPTMPPAKAPVDEGTLGQSNLSPALAKGEAPGVEKESERLSAPYALDAGRATPP